MLIAVASPQHYRSDLHTTNESTRIYAAIAMAKYGTVYLDPVFDEFTPRWRHRDRPPNMDVAWRNGHYILDKAPGTSLAAVPVLLGLQALSVELRYHQLAWLLTLFFSSLPSAAGAAWLYRLFSRTLGPRTGPLSVAMLISTPWAIYAGLFFGHALAAALTLGGLVLTLGPLRLLPDAREEVEPTGWIRPLLGGLVLGLAVMVEYPVFLTAASVVLALAIARQARTLLLTIAGASGPAVALMGWNWAAFGSPFALSYRFKANPDLAAAHAQGLFGVALPTSESLVGLLISPARGLLFYAPWLVLALPGVWLSWRRASLPLPWKVNLLLSLATPVLLTGAVHWHGGQAVGPRYILFCIPALSVAAAVAVAHMSKACLRRWGTAALAGLFATGLVLSGSLALTFPYLSIAVVNPVHEVAFPILGSSGPGPTVWDFFLPRPTGALLAMGAALSALFLCHTSSARVGGGKRKERLPCHRPVPSIHFRGMLLLLLTAIGALAASRSWWTTDPEGQAALKRERRFADLYLRHARDKAAETSQ